MWLHVHSKKGGGGCRGKIHKYGVGRGAAGMGYLYRVAQSIVRG